MQPVLKFDFQNQSVAFGTSNTYVWNKIDQIYGEYGTLVKVESSC